VGSSGPTTHQRESPWPQRNLFWLPSYVSTYLFACSLLIALMMAVSTSETLVNFYETTWSNIPEDSNFCICRENLKSHSDVNIYFLYFIIICFLWFHMIGNSQLIFRRYTFQILVWLLLVFLTEVSLILTL
jgi:hypothetical protein